MATALFWVAVVQPVCAELAAKVDRTEISVDDEFQLEITKSGGRTGSVPDFSLLESDFDILGSPSTRLSATSTVDGNDRTANVTQSWIQTLKPKHTGEIKIPPITVGRETTDPIVIKVLDSTGAGKSPDYFLEVEVSPKDPYIQQQILYTIRLYVGVAMSNMRLTEPKLENAIIEELRGDQNVVTRNGRRYDVVTKRYAIFPQSSGKVRIAPLHFQGRMPLRKSQDAFSRFDPFGPEPFGLRRGRTVRANSKAFNLEIKPRATKSGDWLPAQALRIEDTPDSAVLKLGEPFTRTITVQVRGLSAIQLPDIDMAKSDDYTMFADQPEVENNKNGNSLQGMKQRKIAIVPKKAGQLILPPMKIRWWDTVKHKAQVAQIPERRFKVLAAAGTASKPPQNPVTLNKNITVTESGNNRGGTSAGWWPWLSLVMFLAWSFTTVLWIRDRQRTTPSTGARQPNEKERLKSTHASRKALLLACKVNRPAAARDALLNWATVVWKAQAPKTLVGLAKRIDDEPVKKLVMELDKALYTNSSAWQGQQLAQAMENYQLKMQHQTKTLEALLPPLNPVRA